MVVWSQAVAGLRNGLLGEFMNKRASLRLIIPLVLPLAAVALSGACATQATYPAAWPTREAPTADGDGPHLAGSYRGELA
jgi:hypothetical protein